MPNIRLTLAYDGTEFCGWQIQPRERTVQGELQAAIRALTGENVSVLAAGRTDSGVHALGQVANFITSSTIPPEKWRPALQGKLPRDVVILDSREVAMDFHATYSAIAKRYRYVIRNRLVDDPFVGRYAWRIGGELNTRAMADAARALLGTHDFRCFETEWPNKASSVRTVHEVRFWSTPRWPAWSEAAPQQPPLVVDIGGATDGPQSQPPTFEPPRPEPAEFLCFEIEADGFLYNMVRTIVGTLVNVGRGKWPGDCIERIIAAGDRSTAGETAPAHGLYLVRVRYPDDSP